jgi:hypothetical protein
MRAGQYTPNGSQLMPNESQLMPGLMAHRVLFSVLQR